MSLAVRIDLDSTTPHYEQLRAQIAALVAAGDLTDGQRLPTVRALANDLGIAPGTVARTYRDLEAAGLVTTRRRVGTLVTAPPATLSRAAVTEAAARFVRLARDHALTDTEIRDVVAAALIAGGRRAADPAASDD
ncbi:GntR family transcriptional regulator [Cellulosimicrobium composti]|uniref:GntR family transcriptional regulator n=1 Tax=Cellulosimicrobium composti TaxID=2672572 RepID=A0A6N7ZM48_9MICO|nr:GntR family transcriptional regulator [Cellulosimicrobium composti]MTG90581.1 GntR family transcriptional regulator [Cellulosimicrobium composti]TWG81911.1 GntR family transcriptional regulator [Cellulosimicrobium cellulans J34]SMF38160.1 transcriptional regulator, GntR family [Cellulosimicrobium cellulans J1]